VTNDCKIDRKSSRMNLENVLHRKFYISNVNEKIHEKIKTFIKMKKDMDF
jgi:hypothetical protein